MRNGFMMRVLIVVMGLSIGTIARHYYPPPPPKLTAEEQQALNAILRTQEAPPPFPGMGFGGFPDERLGFPSQEKK